MGLRRDRLDTRMADQRVSRRVNGMLKTKERVRRRARMLGLVKSGVYPYTSSIRSFLSVELDTTWVRISEEDVKNFLAQV